MSCRLLEMKKDRFWQHKLVQNIKKHILVINTHLDYEPAVKSTQIDDLMTVIDYFKGDIKFLCGDFNLLPTTEHYQKIAENWMTLILKARTWKINQILKTEILKHRELII